MKKLIAVMLFGIALLGTPSAQNLKSDDLQGKVHTIEEETWGLTLKFGEYVKNDLINKKTYTYDARGNLTENAEYKANGSLDGKVIYTYDARSNITELAYYKADGSLDRKAIYTYDDKGNMTEAASYNTDGSLAWKDIYTYEYDKFGNWTKEIISAEVSKFGKVYLEPQVVTIRTITYYPWGKTE